MPPLRIREGAVEVEAIMDAIRARVRLRAAAGLPFAAADRDRLGAERLRPLADWNFPLEVWEAMWPPNLRPWNLDQDFPIRSHRGALGRLLIGGKRLARRLLGLAARPLVAQQTEINRTLALVARALADEASATRLHLRAVEGRTLRMASLLREMRGEEEPLITFEPDGAADRGDGRAPREGVWEGEGGTVRIALVVQRYGEEVAGGAELHARYVASLLARAHQVEVLTTTALDYLTWAPHYRPGPDRVEDVAVLRFPVERPRDMGRFAAASARAFAPGHGRDDERAWLEEQGPWAPALWRHLAEAPGRYDAVVAFSYRYVTAVEAARVMPLRTLLVPTAENDPVVGLEVARDLFRSVGAIAYNSPEERALIEAAALGPPPEAGMSGGPPPEAGMSGGAGAAAPGEVVGIGSRIPARPEAKRFRDRHGVAGPYLLYVGRIDANKGCPEMFEYFASFLAETGLPHALLLVGQPVVDIPRHPRIRHLGFLADEDKFDALAGADVLLVPSPYESLSMVTLEAMALGVPPLVNGRCDVLRGQVRRANAGLYYDDYEEFFEALSLLVSTPRLRAALGAGGRAFYRATYDDAIVAAKYERLLASLPR